MEMVSDGLIRIVKQKPLLTGDAPLGFQHKYTVFHYSVRGNFSREDRPKVIA
jgi:hypothetical protein